MMTDVRERARKLAWGVGIAFVVWGVQRFIAVATQQAKDLQARGARINWARRVLLDAAAYDVALPVVQDVQAIGGPRARHLRPVRRNE